MRNGGKSRKRKIICASALTGTVFALAIAVLIALWGARIVPTAIYARYVIVLLFGGSMVYVTTLECERQKEQDEERTRFDRLKKSIVTWCEPDKKTTEEEKR